MTVEILRDQEILQDATKVLLEHLPPDKVVRFWAAWQIGSGDYLALRDQLFGDETVRTLYEKVKDYQAGKTP
jgi:hypothetical protein